MTGMPPLARFFAGFSDYSDHRYPIHGEQLRSMTQIAYVMGPLRRRGSQPDLTSYHP